MKKRSFGKVLGWLLAMVMVISLLPATALTARAAESGWTWTRIAGSTRYNTMKAITQEAYKDSEKNTLKTLILATGESFPDALSGAALAGVYDCPIILTAAKSLSGQAKSEIQRLAAKDCTVLILGGTGAVSQAVEDAVKALGVKVERVAGSTRLKTASAVYNKGLAAANGFKGNDTVIITTGYNYADALSISPYAYASKTPILLTNKDGSLAADVKNLIKSAGFKKAIIVGGTGAVAAATETYLKDQKLTTLRLSGNTRYQTSAAIMKWEMGLNTSAAIQPAVKLTNAGMGVATGENYPDALASAGLLGKTKSALMLVDASKKANKTALEKNIAELIKPYADKMGKGYIFGGTGAVTKEIEDLLNEAVKGAEQPEEPEVLTVDEVLDIMERYENSEVSDKIYTVKGVATSSTYKKTDTYTSYTVWLQSNDGSTEKAFELFSVGMDPSIEKEEYQVKNGLKGRTITCTGYLQKYEKNGVVTLEMPFLSKNPANEEESYTPQITKVEGEGSEEPPVEPPVEGEDPVVDKVYTVDEILAAMKDYTDGQISKNQCTVVGVATSSSYYSKYSSYTIWLQSDDGKTAEAFQLYSVGLDASITDNYTAANALKGKTITCKGYVQKYVDGNGTKFEMPFLNEDPADKTKSFTPTITKVGGEGGEEPPVDPPVGEDPVEDKTYTVDEILAAMKDYTDDQISKVQCTVVGKATSSHFNSSYDSYTIWLESNDGSNAQAFELYSVKLGTSITDKYTVEDSLKGATITCRGYVKRYNDTKNGVIVFEMGFLSKGPDGQSDAFSPTITKIEGGTPDPETPPEQPGEYTWVKSSWDAINENEEFAVTMSKDGVTWILTGTNGTSATPPAEAVTLSSDGKSFVTQTTGNYGWVKSPVTGGQMLCLASNTAVHLYTPDSNGGLRVGKGSDTSFALIALDSESGYLTLANPEGALRYVGVWLDKGTPKDFRSYTTVHNNIKDEELGIWKLQKNN